jgi:hypothetical protein
LNKINESLKIYLEKANTLNESINNNYFKQGVKKLQKASKWLNKGRDKLLEELVNINPQKNQKNN